MRPVRRILMQISPALPLFATVCQCQSRARVSFRFAVMNCPIIVSYSAANGAIIQRDATLQQLIGALYSVNRAANLNLSCLALLRLARCVRANALLLVALHNTATELTEAVQRKQKLLRLHLHLHRSPCASCQISGAQAQEQPPLFVPGSPLAHMQIARIIEFQP